MMACTKVIVFPSRCAICNTKLTPRDFNYLAAIEGEADLRFFYQPVQCKKPRHSVLGQGHRGCCRCWRLFSSPMRNLADSALGQRCNHTHAEALSVRAYLKAVRSLELWF